jgi:Tol biopolymer transport system component/DNA-binding winged helix-turn-helix (wHTH) protein
MTQSFEFGEFRLELEERRLLCKGQELSLAPKVFDTLVLLVENPGHLITKDEFLKRLWPDSFVGEDALAQNISHLRRVLAQGANGKEYVATVPRRGYRFIADVTAMPVHQPVSEQSPPDVNNPGRQAAISQTATLSPSGPSVCQHVNEIRAEKHGFRAGWTRTVIVSSIVGLTCGVATFLVLRPPVKNEIKVTGFVRLTSDGHAKGFPLRTDGTRIYTTEYFPGTGSFLVQVSVNGGEATPFTTPFRRLRLADISRDGTELLLTIDEKSGPPSLWIQSAVGGTTRRVGELVVDNASWGPDDQTIAYTTGQDIYLAKKDGTLSRRLLSVPGSPSDLEFSPDGTKLRFSLADTQGRNTLLWEASASGSQPHPLLPGWNHPVSECCGSWTADGRYFVFESEQNGRREIWALRENDTQKGSSRHAPEQLTAGPIDFSDPIGSKDGRELFAVGTVPRAEVVRYDLREHRFIPYLSGVSAEGLDFSRDGNWVTYVAYPEGTLWRSRVDGTDRVQLTFQPMRVLLPRWSPDGKQIAFLGSPPSGRWILGGPWKIYLVSTDGGSPQQLLPGETNEADPTWSADGNSIVFGSIPWPEASGEDHADMNIQVVDLKTHQLSKLPGSDGLFSPRWSPDGRYIIATNSSHPMKPRLFDWATKKWAILSDSEMGYPSWSQDGKYIYMQDWNDGHPRIARLRLHDRQIEGMVYFNEVGSAMVGTIAGWSGVAPDGSPLVARDVSSQELYALKLHVP